MKNIDLMPLEEGRSSNVAGTGYDAESETLRVQFKSGGVYDYLDVPKAVHSGLLAAESPGRYLRRQVIKTFVCLKVSPTKEG